jgi:hypothetical protein
MTSPTEDVFAYGGQICARPRIAQLALRGKNNQQEETLCKT